MNRETVIIYSSNQSLEAQATAEGKTLIGKKFKFVSGKKPAEQAKEFGSQFGTMLLEKKVKAIRYERNKNRYHGRVKAFADGMREAGIEF